ncbi:hypothetical protein RJ55_06712 [Drechmeria coniospora]|nr:hypothetical protein RJ55_06712 [Drechmeria coniospora]
MQLITYLHVQYPYTYSGMVVSGNVFAPRPAIVHVGRLLAEASGRHVSPRRVDPSTHHPHHARVQQDDASCSPLVG